MSEEQIQQPATAKRRGWLSFILSPWFAIPVLLIVMLLSTPLLIRGYKLAGVPDIGEPFNVEEFVTYSIPEDQNAFTEYRQAASLLISSDNLEDDEFGKAMHFGWNGASDSIREWVATNRPALKIWKQGTAKDKALYIDPKTVSISTMLDVIQHMRDFSRLVKIETSRLESEGEFDEAWEWHRAAFRSSRHCGQYGTIIERLVGIAMHQICGEGISRWSNNSEVTSEQIENAIDDLKQDYRLTAPISNMFKTEYITQINAVAELGSQEVASQLGVSEHWGSLGMWVMGEPELHLLTMNMAMDNWLTYIDKPYSARPTVDYMTIGLFQRTNAGREVKGKYIPTNIEIDAAIKKSLVAQFMLPAIGQADQAVFRERALHQCLLISLAAQAYRRKHGDFPTSADDFIEEYLQTVPNDPFGKANDKLKYRKDPNGFTTWSVGPNRTDDGGVLEAPDETDIGYQIPVKTPEFEESSE